MHRKTLISLAGFFLSLMLSATVFGQPREVIPPPPDPNIRYTINVPAGGLPDLLRPRAWRVPLVSAHRGGPMPGYPENAIETFDRATQYGPSFIELDIRKSRDGVLLLMHDRTLERTTTGTGTVAAQDWTDMQTLQLRDNDGAVTDFTVPTLNQALLWARGRAVLMLDIKRGVTAAEVLQAVLAAEALDHVIFIARSVEEGQALHAAAPGAMINLSAPDEARLAAVMASGIPARNLIVWTGISLRDPAYYGAIHAAGMRVAMGTLGFDASGLDRQIAAADTPERYLEIYASGVDMISTDRHWAVHALLRAPLLYQLGRMPMEATGRAKK